MLNFDQRQYEIRCEWGLQGVLKLAPISDVVIVVDVLSFSTCIDIATSRGAIVFPYLWKDDSVQSFAKSVQAEVADRRGGSRYSLSPASLMHIPSATRLVLPSPNGSSLSLATKAVPTLAGCLRNCDAIAQAAQHYGKRIAVIPAGERWDDGSLRPSLEDWIGAGAIICALDGCLSPEAQTAAIAYQGIQSSVQNLIQHSVSGQELIDRGFAEDVEFATELNVSDCVPVLRDRAYVNAASLWHEWHEWHE